MDTIDAMYITIDIIDIIDTTGISDIIVTIDIIIYIDVMGLLCAPCGTPIGFLDMMSFVVGLSVRALALLSNPFSVNKDSYGFPMAFLYTDQQQGCPFCPVLRCNCCPILVVQ